MKKIVYWFFMPAIITLLLAGCKKLNTETPAAEGRAATASPGGSYATRIHNWLQQRKAGRNATSRAIIDDLESHLDYSTLQVERYSDTVNMVSVKLTPGHNTVNNKNKPVTNYLLLFEAEDGTLSGGYNMQYHAASGATNVTLPKGAFADLYNSKPTAVDGEYTALRVDDVFDHSFTIKNGQMAATQYFERRAGGQAARTCTNWYLLTIYFDNNGTIVSVTEEFLGATCDDDCVWGAREGGRIACYEDGHGGGGGDGGPETPPDYDVARITDTWIVGAAINGSWTVYSTEKLEGKKVYNYPNAGNGYFTKATHIPSYVVNSVAPQGVPYTTYREITGLTVVNSISLVTADVRGLVTVYTGQDIIVGNKKGFIFFKEFPGKYQD